MTQRSAALSCARVSGLVQGVASSPGNLVARGFAVATIAKVDTLRGHFGIDPALARRVPSGTRIRFAPWGGGASCGVPNLTVAPVVDPLTRLASGRHMQRINQLTVSRH